MEERNWHGQELARLRKVKSDYQVDEILSGNATEEIKNRAAKARFDERLALLGLLLEKITEETRVRIEKEDMILDLLGILKNVKAEMLETAAEPVEVLDGWIRQQKGALDSGKKAKFFSDSKLYALNRIIVILGEEMKQLLESGKKTDGAAAFQVLRKDFEQRVADMKKESELTGKRLDHLFVFCEEVFSEGQELLILVTELTINEYAAKFISRHGCSRYFAHNKELLFYERNQEIISKLDELEFV
ncbi:MAG: hypothetical protein GX425_06240 [Peptococcaceae bacterium]|nr:hypothetical protein [Peptococcaceae bacterium]